MRLILLWLWLNGVGDILDRHRLSDGLLDDWRRRNPFTTRFRSARRQHGAWCGLPLGHSLLIDPNPRKLLPVLRRLSLA
jgi:hypothetical protein